MSACYKSPCRHSRLLFPKSGGSSSRKWCNVRIDREAYCLAKEAFHLIYIYNIIYICVCVCVDANIFYIIMNSVWILLLTKIYVAGHGLGMWRMIVALLLLGHACWLAHIWSRWWQNSTVTRSHGINFYYSTDIFHAYATGIFSGKAGFLS